MINKKKLAMSLIPFLHFVLSIVVPFSLLESQLAIAIFVFSFFGAYLFICFGVMMYVFISGWWEWVHDRDPIVEGRSF